MKKIKQFLKPTWAKLGVSLILLLIGALGFNMVGDPPVKELMPLAIPLALGYMLLYGILINPFLLLVSEDLLSKIPNVHPFFIGMYLYLVSCTLIHLLQPGLFGKFKS